MATPSNPGVQAFAAPAPVSASKFSCETSPELEAELRRAVEDFERGDYIELTVEQLARCIATGESPWPE